MSWRAFGETFVTLVVITDPVGNAPIFLTITRRLEPAERQRAAIQAVVAAGALIVGFAIFGELVLRYLRVTIESLSIAGGLLLLLVALEMLRGTDLPTADAEDVALVPLATPLVAGPARSRPRWCFGAAIRTSRGTSPSWSASSRPSRASAPRCWSPSVSRARSGRL
jgi:MarC family membrane protein